MTPSTGEVSKSDAAPDATLQGTAAPFSHELLIAPAENGNVITYALGGEYKTLNLEVATTGNASSTAGTSFTVDIDGTPFPLFGQTDVKDFFPGLTEPTMWIINVSGAQKLQLTLRDTNGVQGTSLLISGELDS